ncbi:MAG TPA: hypothetical protein VMG13_05055, partial [Trebonia sp.]|nr:hypothetical protein [Trebonia sp.]
FRGVNQNVAGISLSSLSQRYSLPITQVVPSDQAMIRQTITASSLGAAQTVVSQLQSGAVSCRQKWQALVSWQTKEQSYLSALSAYEAQKTRKGTAPKNTAGPQPPTPTATECAPASAFGISAGALPGSTQPVTAPVTSPSAHSTATPKTSTSARAAA